MKITLMFLAAALLASPAAHAACTMEEANRLASDLGEKVNEITESDPERAAAVNQELHDMKLKRTADSLGTECEAYKTRMRELERAEDQADIPE